MNKDLHIWYLGLEKIESRYTLQLTEWNKREFKRLGVPFTEVVGKELPTTQGKIVTGSVLDAHGRTHYSLTQVASLVAAFKAGKVKNSHVVFLEDMFTPGIESLAYIIDQTPKEYRPKIYVRCLAQTIDPDDFVNRCGMFRWMRPYELMLDSFVDGILVASEEMVANLRIAGFKSNIYVTGLPFLKSEVLSRVKNIKPFEQRPDVVSYAARWDDEKQPGFFLSVIDAVINQYPQIKFQILTGSPELKSNNPKWVKWALTYQNSGRLIIKTGLKKNEYYKHLANSKILFNCALQDWVSNTVSEADTLGCYTLFPAYRSFPETMANNRRHLYIPWSIEDAALSIIHIMEGSLVQNPGRISDYQSKTIERTVRVFQGKGQRYARNGLDYRKHVSVSKW